ncbi:MAG: glycosyltransferase [Xanthomonadales bacterium]|nr:glycosyltransferase [Gammaproteobacteria bacterium]NNK03711.1 glycosyltransferase [Xanthomonadales bacterium]
METTRQGRSVELSILVPVFNEEDVLALLFGRLYPVLDALERPFEVLFVNDGSSDQSGKILAHQFEQRPDVTRVISLSSNAGQHAALIAGFQRAKGDFIVTLDADLQNPPEEIPAVVAEMDKGFDYVGSIRASRHDRAWRHIASRLMNALREKITNIRMTDQGCMLRGYSRDIALEIAASNESRTFIPALAYLYAARPTEITVAHEERAGGQSKYSLFKLVQLNFDLITSFSSVPLQLISITGIVVSILSFLFVCYLAFRRLFYGPEVEGVFTLFGITIFLMGLLLFSMGMLGEYIGRINGLVRRRKRFRVASVLEADEGVKSPVDEADSATGPE